MVKYKGILVHFGEIWLKGRNRNDFIRAVRRNLEAALKGERYSELTFIRDRLLITLSDGSKIESIISKASKVFGISRISPVIMSKNDLASILRSANSLFRKGEIVRIVPHRSVKDMGFDSNGIVMHFISNQKKLKFGIDKDAENKLYINCTRDMTFLYREKIKGANGLPVGSSGSAVVMLSGGIDSPVASFYAMKRGLKPIYMHVHAFPDNKAKELSKIRRMAKMLSAYCPDSKLLLMPGHVFQSYAMKVPKRYELVFFKYFLYRLADRIAEMEGADCIVTGESLGQVASQTIQNLGSSSKGLEHFVVRPLIGFDKQEIIDAAKRIGTFDLSIEKYRDVCSITARNPATKSNPAMLGRLWEEASMEKALALTIKRMES